MQRNDVHSPRDLHGRLLWEPACPMVHLAAAAITLCFLLIYLILAAGPARECSGCSPNWMSYCTAQAILVPMCIHLALLVLRAPISNPQIWLAWLVLGVAYLFFLFMLRLAWLGSLAELGWATPGLQWVIDVSLVFALGGLALTLEVLTAGCVPWPTLVPGQ